MEVDDSRVGVPARQQPPDFLVVERAVDVEEAFKLAACAVVISGKDVQPAIAPTMMNVCSLI